MFGGLAFMVNGHMCCGVLNDDLVLRGSRGIRQRDLSSVCALHGLYWPTNARAPLCEPCGFSICSRPEDMGSAEFRVRLFPAFQVSSHFLAHHCASSRPLGVWPTNSTARR